MRIEHIAIWTNELERSREFYCNYFSGTSNEKYVNSKHFESYFITFSDGARLEIMREPGMNQRPKDAMPIGLSHFAFSVGSKENVDQLTERLKNDGYCVVSAPRSTGDGYYESCVLDPDGNRVEITV